ncbi:hypothetical protein HDU93_001192 [Gonapodya sp. JEL0774]|nr:hypothetical protein HDU93_001192 [Gonapodya sp. JEL0774]
MSRSSTIGEKTPLLASPASLTNTDGNDGLIPDGVLPPEVDAAVEQLAVEVEETGEQLGKRVHSWFQDWSEFLATTGVASFGVGVVLGGVYSGLLTSFIEDLVLPPFEVIWGKYLGDVYVILKPGRSGPPYDSLVDAKNDGAITENYGKFIHVFVNTLIITLVMAGLVGSIKLPNLYRMYSAYPPKGKAAIQPAAQNSTNEKVQSSQDEAKF